MFENLEEAINAVHAGEAVLLDVRSRGEHEQVAALHSIHFDVQDIAAGHTPEIEKDRVILIHCRSGARAGMACTLLKARGFTSVQNIGGLNNWLSAGGQIKE